MDRASEKAAIVRAGSLLATDPAAAEREARRVLDRSPGEPNARLVLAAALRRQGRAADAVALIEPLIQAAPSVGLAQFEFGVALADIGRHEDAIAALKAATRLQPDRAEAWSALGQALFNAGDGRGAIAAFDQQARAMVRQPHLAAAADAVYDGRLDEAEALLRPILATDRKDVAAVRLLAETQARRGRHVDAARSFAAALELDPNDEQTRFRLATELYYQQKPAEALDHIKRLVEAAPGNAAYLNLYAGALTRTGGYEQAVAVFETLLASFPRQALLWVNYGRVLRTVGRRDEAIAAYRKAMELEPDMAAAYVGLANLKVESLTDAETQALYGLVGQADLAAAERSQLAFALGKALEDRAQYAASFAAYVHGAKLRRAEITYDPQLLTRQVARTRSLLSAEFFAARSEFGTDAPDPIFVVGLPRSGSTLVEQILASHSQVEGTMELPDIGFSADRLGTHPDALAAVTLEQSKALGEGYLASTRLHRRLGRPFFVDKMPNNFLFIGLIQLILPRAKIIDARRHPLATCFSSFKQHFVHGQSFSYDLAELGRYYRDYLALMTHFQQVLPGRVLRVVYEDLVEDTEGQVRRLLDHCGLAFEPGCLAFYETERPVHTVSSEQVRQPIYREGLDLWRRYEPWLGPLKTALGPALETWRD
jgi:tetratricopeptide (TPR) repeat protein